MSAISEVRVRVFTEAVKHFFAQLADDQVAAGRVDTRYVDDNLARFAAGAGDAEPAAVACAGALALLARPAEAGPASPWLGAGEAGTLDRVHLDPAAPLGRVSVTGGGRRSTARLLARGSGRAVVAVGDGTGAHAYRVSGARGDDGVWSGRVDDCDFSALVSHDAVELVVGGRRVRLETACDGSDADDGGLVAVAPMPGTVTAVRAGEGDSVARGQVLLIVESMKTENPVPAPADGVVAEVKVRVGAAVAANQVLVLLTPRTNRP